MKSSGPPRMLVLSRKGSETVMIGDTHRVTVVSIAPTCDEIALRHSNNEATQIIRAIGDDRIKIDHDIEVIVVRILNDRVRLGIVSPEGTVVHRLEIWEQLNAHRKRDGDDSDGMK